MMALTKLKNCTKLFNSSANRLTASLSSDSKCKEGNLPVLLDRETALLSPKEKEHAKQLKEGQIEVDTPMDLTLISGVPEEHIKGRRVRIFASTKNAMQSGTFNMGQWTMEFDTRERWENPLIGWSSSGDPLSNMQIQFQSQAEAVDFCEKNGWYWFIDQENTINARAKAYAANFSWNKRSRVSTK